MKPMTIVRVCLAFAAVGVVGLVLASAWPSLDFRVPALFAVMLLMAALIACIGAGMRHLAKVVFNIELTWWLLLTSAVLIFLLYLGLFLPSDRAHAAAIQRAMNLAACIFAFLGLGAAAVRDGKFSSLVGMLGILATAFFGLQIFVMGLW